MDDEFDSPGAVETGKRCQTASYRYAINASDGDPLVRWEYDRSKPRPDYEYPLAHVHVHGTLRDGTELESLHIPTERTSLELVLWHLISESAWGVRPRSDRWQSILRDSIAGFSERRST